MHRQSSTVFAERSLLTVLMVAAIHLRLARCLIFWVHYAVAISTDTALLDPGLEGTTALLRGIFLCFGTQLLAEFRNPDCTNLHHYLSSSTELSTTHFIDSA